MIYRITIEEKNNPSNDVIRDYAWTELSDPQTVGNSILDMVSTLKKALLPCSGCGEDHDPEYCTKGFNN